MKRYLGIIALLCFSVVMLAGCAAERLNEDGLELIKEGRYEEGISKLDQAAKEDPKNLHFRAQYREKKDEVLNRILLSADQERAIERWAEAEKLYHRALAIEAGNVRATSGLAEIARDQRHQALVDEARVLLEQADIEGAWNKLRQVSVESPKHSKMLELRREIEEIQAKEAFTTPSLKSLYTNPVSLEFRDANLKMVFDVLSRTSGINFIFDKAVRSDLTTTIFVKKASLEDVVDLLLSTNQLEKKVLNSNSILIYPNTPDKVREYQDLVVKSFYLENADVKQTMNLVKTMLKTRDIFVDEKLNLMIIRDTPEAIRLAEKLVAMLDLAEPEVMLEVEVLEVTRTRLLDLGVKYPDQLTLSPLAMAGGVMTLSDLRSLRPNQIGAATSNVIVNARKDDTDVNILANPRIRTRNREKARIMIGDRVPVITTTSSSTGFVGDSVQYVDVGLKLEVEPNIYLNDDVAIKVSLEVSSIVNQVTSKNGTQTYQIGSRTASTVLRLKDGETQVLAGLINDSDRSTANKIPGMGDLPMLGRLFSTHRDDKQKTEIVLSITPHLVRKLERPEAVASGFWSGSEAMLRSSPLMLRPQRKAHKNADAVNGEKVANPTTDGLSEVDAESGMPRKEMEAPSYVELSWQGPVEVRRGDTFKLSVNLKSDGGLRGLPFQLAYDPAVLKISEVSEGEFFRQGNVQTSFANNIDAASGRLFVGVTRSGSSGAMGDGTLTTVTFQALSSTPKTEVILLSATPIVGNKVSSPQLPSAFVISINN